jgi:hypothetical protein
MDNQSGVILKRVVLDQVGAQVGFFQFTQIDFNPIIRPGDFAIQVRGAIRLTLHDKLHELAARNGLLPLEVKQNQYVLDGVSMVRPTGISVLHETYAGPKGKLSLFQVAGLVDLSHIKPTDERGLAFFGWQLNGHSFALIGNYSVPELKQLSTQLGEVRNGK